MQPHPLAHVEKVADTNICRIAEGVIRTHPDMRQAQFCHAWWILEGIKPAGYRVFLFDRLVFFDTSTRSGGVSRTASRFVWCSTMRSRLSRSDTSWFQINPHDRHLHIRTLISSSLSDRHTGQTRIGFSFF